MCLKLLENGAVLLGQRFSGANETEVRIYLLGNPVLWWGNICCLAVFLICFMIWAIRYQRRCDNGVPETDRDGEVMINCAWLFLGWVLHYLPFYFMGRVLYFHHYFPAMLFNSMLSGILIDHVVSRVQSKLQSHLHFNALLWVHGPLFAIIVYSFFLFSPLSYGMTGLYASRVNSTFSHLQWLDSWEI